MGWPFTIVYLLLIFGAIYFTSVIVPKKLNRNNWPQTQASVIETEVTKRKKSSKAGNVITVYSGKVKYAYTVANSNYNSEELIEPDHKTSELISQSLEKYTQGRQLTVYYNPDNPSISVLQPALSTKTIITGLFFLISIGVMAFALYDNARKRK